MFFDIALVLPPTCLGPSLRRAYTPIRPNRTHTRSRCTHSARCSRDEESSIPANRRSGGRERRRLVSYTRAKRGENNIFPALYSVRFTTARTPKFTILVTGPALQRDWYTATRTPEFFKFWHASTDIPFAVQTFFFCTTVVIAEALHRSIKGYGRAT